MKGPAPRPPRSATPSSPATSPAGARPAPAGPAGQGVGGGIYGTGTVFAHHVAVNGNHLATSDDNVFGDLTERGGPPPPRSALR